MNHPGHNDIHRAASDPWYRISYENDRRMAQFNNDMAALKQQGRSNGSQGSGAGASSGITYTGGGGEAAGLTVIVVGAVFLLAVVWTLVSELVGWIVRTLENMWTGAVTIWAGAVTAVTHYPIEMAVYGGVVALVLLAMRAFAELRLKPILLSCMLFAVATAMLVYLVQHLGVKSSIFVSFWSTYAGLSFILGFPVYSAIVACLILPFFRKMKRIALRDFIPTIARTSWKALIVIWCISGGLAFVMIKAGENVRWELLPSIREALLATLFFAAIQSVCLLAIWMRQRT